MSSQNTKKQIMNTFMLLYAEKDYFQITVKEICHRADLHRSTFYLYFESIDHMMRELEDELLEEISDLCTMFFSLDMSTLNLDTIIGNKEFSKLMEYFYDKKDYLIPLLSPNGDPYFIKKFKDIIRRDYEMGLQNNRMNL